VIRQVAAGAVALALSGCDGGDLEQAGASREGRKESRVTRVVDGDTVVLRGLG
jgi:endonuclease YncB( thermonuclease family)